MDYFFNPDLSLGSYFLNKEESKHCVLVLRHRSGDRIQAIDGKGGMYTCEIITADPSKTTFKIIGEKHVPAKEYSIHIAISPTKNMDRMEWFVEKTVEIGIDVITFIHCHNSERNSLKTDRLLKKAIGALKQSGNVFMPEMNDLIPFKDFLMQEFYQNLLFIGHAEKGRNCPILKEAESRQHYLILIGPEGDFTNDELMLAFEKGFRPVSLGNSRLRTETAGVFSCSILNSLNT